VGQCRGAAGGGAFRGAAGEMASIGLGLSCPRSGEGQPQIEGRDSRSIHRDPQRRGGGGKEDDTWPRPVFLK